MDVIEVIHKDVTYMVLDVVLRSVSLSQPPRESSRSESEWVSLKYIFTSEWLLLSFPDCRVFVNVYWFTTYAGLFFVFFLLLHLSSRIFAIVFPHSRTAL